MTWILFLVPHCENYQLYGQTFNIKNTMKNIFVLLFIVIGTLTASTQKIWQKQGIKAAPPICYASGLVEKSYIPPPPEFLNRLKSTSEQKSEIIVKYSLFPSEAKEAFEYAVGIWEYIVESPIPIHIQANWRSKDANVLGSCGPSDFFANFKDAPMENRYYPVALVEKITNTEISGATEADMNAEFNKNVDWYFGADGNTPDSLFDFVSIVLHEIAHGLGFTGFFDVNGELGDYGWNNNEATSFDLLVVKNNGDQLVDTEIFGNPSEELKKALVSGVLYANSPVAIVDGSGYKPRLYAPTTWNNGSSIYHLNDATYPKGNANSLMTHAAGKGEAIHDPGPITKGLMADFGWKQMYIDFNRLKDIEETAPLTFNVNIKSDYELDTAALFVIFSVDSFITHVDTLNLLPTAEPNLFSAQLEPAVETEKIHYYIVSSDIKTRVFTLPTDAPKTLYSIAIGPDNELPVVEHFPIPYFFLSDEKLYVEVKANDNIGIDTVTIEYEINGVPQTPFGLSYKMEDMYSGYFNFDLNQLSDGDIITYNVIAKDASTTQNTKIIPSKDVFTFKIEEKFDPIGGYTNNFDNPTNGFIISDFDIYTEIGFENGALHSPHPYPSPNEDDSYFNFSTILKHPIILKENGTMSFDEIVLVEPGNTTQFGTDNFWDYVIVEGSKNNGSNWLPLSDGYDANDNSIWSYNYNLNMTDQFSSTEGIPDWFINREINLLGNGNFSTGDTILIRFRLNSDPYANGWGWVIDNLRVQSPVSNQLTVLSPGNIMVYPNPFSDNFKVILQAKNNIDEIQLDVFNIFGQKIKSTLIKNVLGQITEEIYLKEAGVGIYFLTIKENGKQIYSKKIIKH